MAMMLVMKATTSLSAQLTTTFAQTQIFVIYCKIHFLFSFFKLFFFSGN
jgi:hypothetical protein